jgi:hypothetical protein
VNLRACEFDWLILAPKASRMPINLQNIVVDQEVPLTALSSWGLGRPSKDGFQRRALSGILAPHCCRARIFPSTLWSMLATPLRSGIYIILASSAVRKHKTRRERNKRHQQSKDNLMLIEKYLSN